MLDVAADAFENEDRHVVIRRVDESPYRNLESIEDFADVLQDHHNVEVVPNRYFPHVSLMYPLIMHSKNDPKRISLIKDPVLPIMRGLAKGGQASVDFLTESKYAKKRLSLAQETQIEDNLKQRKLDRFLFHPDSYDSEIILDFYSNIFKPQNEEEVKSGKKKFKEIIEYSNMFTGFRMA